MICRAIPYEGKEPYIFVSYCHKDKSKLFPIFEQMVLDGYRMWYDDGNHAGDDWLDNIENHLEDCQVVVAFISDNSSLSHNCKSEIIYAIKCRKKIIPILIDSADLPKGLRMQLSHLHYLKSADYPSNNALLNKVYEAEECKACASPAGSLPLKPDGIHEKDFIEPSKSQMKKKQVIKISNIVKKHKHVAQSAVSNQNKSAASETTPNEASDLIETEMDNNRQNEQVIIPDAVNDGIKTIIHSNCLDNDMTVRINNIVLSILLHPAAKRVYTLRKPQTKIGRSPIKCDVVIEGNESISKLHAEIRQYNQKYFLVDSNSSNGTFMNGEQLEPGKQVELDNPAIFQLNDENLILITGAQAHKLISKGFISLLMNENCSFIRILENDTMPLNRNNKWTDGTLSDAKIHRAAHALLSRKDDGIYLVDESPVGGNGTHMNGSRLKQGESRLLASGDQIRLGDTTLTFISISF